MTCTVGDVHLDVVGFTCNNCVETITGGAAAATLCGHLFCIPCAREMIRDSAACCVEGCLANAEGTPLSRANTKVVSLTPLAERASIFSLVGQHPDAILPAMEMALRFYSQQTSMHYQVQAHESDRQAHDACARIHASYQRKKKQCETLNKKAVHLDKMNTELRQKYEEKSRQKRTLEEELRKLRGGGGGGTPMQYAGGGTPMQYAGGGTPMQYATAGPPPSIPTYGYYF